MAPAPARAPRLPRARLALLLVPLLAVAAVPSAAASDVTQGVLTALGYVPGVSVDMQGCADVLGVDLQTCGTLPPLPLEAILRNVNLMWPGAPPPDQANTCSVLPMAGVEARMSVCVGPGGGSVCVSFTSSDYGVGYETGGGILVYFPAPGPDGDGKTTTGTEIVRYQPNGC
jgi:hypothetical protein